MDFKPSLGSDNHSGVHPKIIEGLLKANLSHAPAYGGDPISQEFEKLIKVNFGSKSQAFLVFNGTAANVLALDSLVRSHEAIICSNQSHLHLDECGAPEKHLGSKLLLIPSNDGKITPEQIEKLLIRRGDQHHVQAGAVSITQPTELGVCYTLEELKQLREFTRAKNLKLHMDGARLANAAHFLNTSLRSLTEEIDLDALSLGGTKNGLLGAECVVFFNSATAKDFKFRRKQFMQLPSKTRFLAAQFVFYLSENLWKEIASHSHKCALFLGEELRKISGVEIIHPIQSNAVFAKFPKAWTKELKQQMFFYIWDEQDWSCRLMTSFDTEMDDLKRFIEKAKSLGDQ